MILFHGTTQIITTIDLSKCRQRTDFGKGFYLGTNLTIAEKWAKSRASFSGKPIVMRYSLDETIFSDVSLNHLYFAEPSIEWLNFVCDNRRKIDFGNYNELRHQHEVVRGPIANDKVNFVVEDYIKGKISAENAIAKAKTLPDVMQISLHSANALIYLQADCAEYQEYLPDGTWSTWQSVND